MSTITVKQVGDNIYVRQPYNSTHDIVRRVDVSDPADNSDPGVTDFTGTVTCLKTATDDPDVLYASPVSTLNSSSDNAPPVKINNTFLGGTHYIYSRVLTKTGHGLGATDVGDSGTDSAAKSWVIVEIIDADRIRVCPANTGTATDWVLNGTVTGSTITFTGAGAFTFTAEAPTPVAYPTNQNYLREIAVDGVVTSDITTATSCSKFEIIERYGIPNCASVLAALIADYPTATPKKINDSSIQTQIEVTIAWRFDTLGGRTSTYSWYNVQDYLLGTTDYIGGQQTNTKAPAGGNKKYLYVPECGVVSGYDLGERADISSNSSNFYVKTSDCDDPTNPASHFATTFTDSNDVPEYGHVIGYRRNRGVGQPAIRAALCDEIFNLSASEKMYPMAVSNKAQPSGGERYTVETYDGFYDMTGLANYTVNKCIEFSDGRVHWIFDCHSSLSSTWVSLPSDLVDRSFRVLDASDSFSVNSGSTVQENGINVSISGGFGRAVIEIESMSNAIKAWKGAVEPAETSPSGNEIQAWKGAVEPAAVTASSTADALIGGVTRSVTRTLTRGVTEGWDWGA